MAAIDYGCIAFKNGKLINTEYFTPMIDMVGWEDTAEDVFEPYFGIEEPIRLNNNYAAFIGDEDLTIAFYKEQIMIVERIGAHLFTIHREYFNFTNYHWWKWTAETHCDDNYTWHAATITKRNGYYVCKWEYKGDKYKVYFGYGVDLPYYKKWRIVNYYRSPEYKLRCLKWRLFGRWLK